MTMSSRPRLLGMLLLFVVLGTIPIAHVNIKYSRALNAAAAIATTGQKTPSGTGAVRQHQVFNELQIYPRVYILPLPSDLNWDLMNCSRVSTDGQNLVDYVDDLFKDDDFVRFEQTSPAHPFGESITTESVTYTPNHPHSDMGEYDFQAYFQRMLEGYIHRVDNPESADLIYIPFFERRLACHPKGYEAAWDLIHSHVAWFMQQYPLYEFFSAFGAVCSCGHSGCYPGWNVPDLTKRFKVIAWERHTNHSEAEGNLIVPYVTQVHDMPWQVNQDRKILVLSTFDYPRNPCINCGPCYHDDYYRKECQVLCKNIRGELIEQMEPYAATHDNVILWTRSHNPSTEWFPNGTNFWPPTQVVQRMMDSAFCLQPSGDTVSRKSFFESIQAGCIPVVFRNDDAYIHQLPFSNIIPYRELYYFIPESCVLQQKCFVVENNTMVPSKNFVEVLRSVPNEAVQKRRKLIKEYGRLLIFSDHDGLEGGYNDVNDPDAFLMSLREMWRLAQK